MSELHYLNQKYKPGAVFDNLSGIGYDMVVGLDIGHGECMAYVYHLNSLGDWVADPLVVADGGETHIPSYIAYKDDKPIIGKKAAAIDGGGLQVYFKRDPGWWETYSDDGVHTYGQLMKDFISTLWKTIVTKNDIFENIEKNGLQDKVLITVGCPASGSWTEQEKMEKYKALVTKATGYKNATILPESNGAIMAAINAGTFDLSRGVAIYDLGSSTLDFTYILMGKALITASIPLGGSDIDKAMLRYIAKKYKLDPGDLNSRDLAPAYTKLRLIKENFYDTNQENQSKESIYISRKLNNCVNEVVLQEVLKRMRIQRDNTHCPFEVQLSGLKEEDVNKAMLDLFLETNNMTGVNIDPDDEEEIFKQLTRARTEFFAQESSTPVYVTISISQTMYCALKKDMMDVIIREDTEVTDNKLDAPYAGLSWAGCVKKFFEDTKNSIERDGYPCDTVILTGGTCKVADVKEIAEEYYPAPCGVIMEPDPSASVARGLCLAKGYERGAREQVETLKNELHGEMQPCFEQLCQDFGRGGLYDLLWSRLCIATAALYDGNDHTYQEFCQKIEDNTVNDLTFINVMTDALKECISDLMDPTKWNQATPHCSEIVREKANKLAEKVYNAEVSTLPKVPKNLISTAAKGFDRNVLADVIKKSGIAITVQRIAVNYLSGKIGGILGFINRVAGQIRVTFNTKLTAAECHQMFLGMCADGAKDNNKAKIGNELSDSLKNNQEFKNAFLKLIDEQFEIAVGIVLFQIFEN